MRAVRWSGIGVAVALAASSCTVKPIVSDTGYQGTWSRGNERVRSTISIVLRNDEAWFRWNQRFEDGTIIVRCEWNGHCEGFLNREKSAEYDFRAWIEPSTRKLRVEGRHKLLKQAVVIHWIDEIDLVDQGKALSVATIERDGVHFKSGEGPHYGFQKVADEVTDPPDGLSGGTSSPAASLTQ